MDNAPPSEFHELHPETVANVNIWALQRFWFKHYAFTWLAVACVTVSELRYITMLHTKV